MWHPHICRLCYRPVLRGVNLSNGTMIHERCLLAAQKKADDLSSKTHRIAKAELTMIYDLFLTYPPDFEERKKRVAGRDGECCSSCRSAGVLHLHHTQPLSKGGTNQLENLTLLCERCHSKAHNNRSVSEPFKEQGTAYAKRVDHLQQAIKAGRRVKFGYKNPQDTGYKSRTIKPIELFTMDHDRDSGSTLCVRGFCESRQENRTFSIKRMRGLTIL